MKGEFPVGSRPLRDEGGPVVSGKLIPARPARQGGDGGKKAAPGGSLGILG